jgi:hypothetical protein
MLIFWSLLAQNNGLFSTKRQSSVFDSYRITYSNFIESTSYQVFMKPTLTFLSDDLTELNKALNSEDDKTDKNKLTVIRKQTQNLKDFIDKIEGIDEAKYQEIKMQLDTYKSVDFTYLANRIDKHSFYYMQEID